MKKLMIIIALTAFTLTACNKKQPCSRMSGKHALVKCDPLVSSDPLDSRCPQ